MGWTPQQQKAIEVRGSDILVSAAAGSGKTAVLTERIARLVAEEKVPLNRILVVTFTEAAAAEMKSRIAAALEAAAGGDDFIDSQLRRIGAAKISTFHAFCLTILRRHYPAIGLDPSFSVCDELRAATLREEAMEETFARSFAMQAEAGREAECQTAEFAAFAELLRNYAGPKDERAVQSMALKTHDFIMTLPEPFDWLERAVTDLYGDPASFQTSAALRFAHEEILYRIRRVKSLTERIGQQLTEGGFLPLAAKNQTDLDAILAIEAAALAEDQEGTRSLLAAYKRAVFRATKSETENGWEDYKALIAARRDRVRDTFKDLLKTFYARDLDTYTKEIEEIAPSAEALVRLVRLFDQVYAEIKRRENVIDFSDIEHMALAILADEAIAEDYRKNIDHIFIDEYQDSNYVQETIVSRITRRGNVFMVGDVKQSIYKFRNAEPAIFLEKLHRFKQEDAEPQDGETVPLSSGLRIDLSANFRSKVGVIAAVNAVFEQVMDARYAGIDYDEDQRLEVGLPCGQEMTRKARLYIAAKDADKAVYANTAESEAAVCAGIIRELLGQDRYDAKADQPRSIEYRDIVILLRSAKGTAETMQKTLEKYGIPAFTDRGEGYFETVEIDTFLGLLKTVINTRRDVPLAAALCSAAFGFDLAELADIRLGKNEGYFYEAFLAYAEGGTDPALREKCRAMILRLAQWRNEERFLPLDEFLWKLMRESGYFDYAGALPHGAQRQANLRGLLDRARDFQKGRVRGLRAFVSYLDRVKKRVAVPQIKLLSEGENVVRILTVHGSKGLEFPVVIQCGLGDSFSKGGFGDGGLLLHREVGLSLQWENRRAHTYKKTLPHHAIRLRREMDERAEDVRLLYVSMTRAMDCLCLVGTVTDPEAVLDLYANTDPDVDTDVPGAKNYLELILPTVCARPDLFDVTALPLDEQALPIGLPHRNPWIPGQARDDKGGAVNRSPQRQLCRIPRRIRIKTSSIKAKKPTFSTRPVFLNNGKALSLNHGGYLSRADAAAAVREAAADHSGYVYPYADEAQLKVKYSVTELTRRDNEAAEAQRTPAAQTKHPSVLTEFTQTKRPPVFTTMQSDHSPVFFFAGSAGETEEDAGLLGQDLTAAEKGTALHKALELLDFKEAYRRCDDLGFFETYLNGLRTIGALTDAEADAVGAERLARFAGSDLCARAARAEFIMKEAPFNMRLPEEGIIVQGVIDLLFREEDGLVVADYKSGHFELGRPGEEERIRETYGGQLALYRRAAEQVFGESVKEALLYMTKSGICIRA